MITNAENSQPNDPTTGCLVSIFTVRITSSLSPVLYAEHEKGTYPNFRATTDALPVAWHCPVLVWPIHRYGFGAA